MGSDRRVLVVRWLRAVLVAGVATFAVGVLLRPEDGSQVLLLDLWVYCGVHVAGAAVLLAQVGPVTRERRA